MISSPLRARVCKNALAHRSMSHATIAVGGTEGRLAPHPTGNLRPFFFFLRWEENYGVL